MHHGQIRTRVYVKTGALKDGSMSPSMSLTNPSKMVSSRKKKKTHKQQKRHDKQTHTHTHLMTSLSSFQEEKPLELRALGFGFLASSSANFSPSWLRCRVPQTCGWHLQNPGVLPLLPTNKWFAMGSKWCEMDFVHSLKSLGAQPLGTLGIWDMGKAVAVGNGALVCQWEPLKWVDMNHRALMSTKKSGTHEHSDPVDNQLAYPTHGYGRTRHIRRFRRKQVGHNWDSRCELIVLTLRAVPTIHPSRVPLGGSHVLAQVSWLKNV